MVRVFVYGSLKTGLGNNVLMKQVGATCLGYDSVTGIFRMISFGGFPGVLRGGCGNRPRTIFGETWMMKPEGLPALDMLECHPNWYERLKYRTNILDKRVWMYTLPLVGYEDTDTYPAVPGEIWQASGDETNFWARHGS